jgi:hypothetical protein
MPDLFPSGSLNQGGFRIRPYGTKRIPFYKTKIFVPYSRKPEINTRNLETSLKTRTQSNYQGTYTLKGVLYQSTQNNPLTITYAIGPPSVPLYELEPTNESG